MTKYQPLFYMVCIMFIMQVIANYGLEQKYQADAIEHNCAYYTPTTGEFTWKDTSK